MRCCFEEDPEANITQIALWQAYQNRFSEFVSKGRPLLAAADFIKNVSTAFSSASAMVIHTSTGTGQKFIIKGIKSRRTPLSTKGIEYVACKWVIQENGMTRPCPHMLPNRGDLFAHILDAHLCPPPVGITPQPQVCRWAGCQRFPPQGDKDRRKVISHVLTHMHGVKRKVPSISSFRRCIIREERTAVDERGEAVGVAVSAALVLKNIARSGHAREELSTLEADIHKVATLNGALTSYMYDILLTKAEEEDKKMELVE